MPIHDPSNRISNRVMNIVALHQYGVHASDTSTGLASTRTLEELADLHATMLRYAHVQQDPSDARNGSGELLGFPMSDATRRSIAALDTLALSNRPAREILVIETNQKIPQHDLCQHLKKLEVDVTHHNLPAPELWEWLEDFGKVRVPLNVVRAIVDWLDEACP